MPDITDPRPQHLHRRRDMAENIRDLSPTRTLVLSHLVKRENDKCGYAWPSLTSICWATHMERSAVSNCLHDLQDLGLIARKPRDGSTRSDRRSHATYLQWAQIAALQRTRAEEEAYSAKQNSDRAAKAATAVDIRKAAKAKAPSATNKSKKAPIFDPVPTADMLLYDRHLCLLRDTFPGHSTFDSPDADRMLLSSLRDCTKLAGSEEKCLEVLEFICLDPRHTSIRTNLSKARKLGGYISSRFAEWMDDSEAWTTACERLLDAQCQGTELELGPEQVDLLPAVTAWMLRKLGDDFISHDQVREGDLLIWSMQISQGFKDQRVYTSEPFEGDPEDGSEAEGVSERKNVSERGNVSAELEAASKICPGIRAMNADDL